MSILGLPSELLLKILVNVDDLNSIKSASMTCTTLWKFIATHDEIFKRIATRQQSQSIGIAGNPQNVTCSFVPTRGKFFNACAGHVFAKRSLIGDFPLLVRLSDATVPYINDEIPESFGKIDTITHSNKRMDLDQVQSQHVAMDMTRDSQIVYARQNAAPTSDKKFVCLDLQNRTLELDNTPTNWTTQLDWYYHEGMFDRDGNFPHYPSFEDECDPYKQAPSSPYINAYGNLVALHARENTLDLYVPEINDFKQVLEVSDAEGIQWNLPGNHVGGRFVQVLGKGENSWPYSLYFDLATGNANLYSLKGWSNVSKVQDSIRKLGPFKPPLDKDLMDSNVELAAQKELLLRGAWVADTRGNVVFLSHFYLEALARAYVSGGHEGPVSLADLARN